MRTISNSEGEDRLITMLASALGSAAGDLILDSSVIELMLNPDGKLWIDRLGQGRGFTGHTLSPADAERVIFIVASSIGAVCNRKVPLLSAELPGCRARFQGVLPPLVRAPAFTIRKKAIKIFTIDDYVKMEVMNEEQSIIIKDAVTARKNILIVGGTGSGKTTLANAILDLISHTDDRIVILEDTEELQCKAADYIALRTEEQTATMRDLLKATLRLRPDRIVVGEVRGPEAIDLIKAWNTGHPGGCATLHADSAEKAFLRLQDLALEGGVQLSTSTLRETISLTIFIRKFGKSRKVTQLMENS